MTARRWTAIAAVALLVIAMTIAAMNLVSGPPNGNSGIAAQIVARSKAGNPPAVEPLVLDTSKPDEARELNAGIPFSTAPNPAARPFHFNGDTTSLDRATDCLAAAMFYEAGDDPKGQRAVGQVVLNRVRHPAYPKTVCGTVFQGQERSTGCQFTFTCDGAMGRIPSPAAWQRARSLSSKMLAGDVYKDVGYSTHYHTDWVMPYWSSSLDKVTAVDTHLFFRWQGFWGTPGAFAKQVAVAAEPAIQKLAFLSPIHRPTDDMLATMPTGLGDLIDDTRPMMAVGPEMIGKRIGPGQLAAIEPGGKGFIMTIDKGGDPGRYADAASRLCSGRGQCRLLAWTSASETPKQFPVEDAELNSMSFAYIRQKDNGIERMLYNCDEFPSAPNIKCMTRLALPSTSRKLAADEQAERTRVKLPDAARPVADMKPGQLMATPRPDAALKPIRPRADASSGGSVTTAGSL